MRYPTNTHALAQNENRRAAYGAQHAAYGLRGTEAAIKAWRLLFAARLWFILPFLLLALLPELGAQSRKELEDKRLKLIEEINQTNKKLQETQKSKAATLERYLALKAQVTKRQQLVATMRAEIAQADSAIARSGEVMIALNDDIERLRKEYSKMLRAAYRLHLQQSWVAFIFSAENLNHAFRRRQYIRQYDRYRRRQALLINETQQMLATKVVQLEQYKAEQQRLMGAAQQQGEILRVEMQDKDRTLQALKTDENHLVKELERREKERERFSAAIESVIREEMAQKRRESRTATAITSPNKSTSSASPAESASTPATDKSAFGSRRGSLPWPVSGGRISRTFGPQPHPTLKDVTVPNNGVDISATAGAEVSVVYDGKVVGVQFVPGYQNMVIVQHGTYYTVYSNLATLTVRRDDQVTAGQSIGKLGQEDLHFELWREKQRINPAGWFR